MTQDLEPAAELARRKPAAWPNESPAYRKARTALLEEEIELRRHLARVAEQRRALPPGGVIPKDYMFDGPGGAVRMSEMFGRHDTLALYAMMYGPEREDVCPMCASMLDAWDGAARHLGKRIALGVVARSPADRLRELAKSRGWTGLAFFGDPSGDYYADYVGDRDADWPAYTVFRRDGDGAIRHFYSGEGGSEIADPGQDPHGAPDPNPLWTILDTTPAGRGTDWYPRNDD